MKAYINFTVEERAINDPDTPTPPLASPAAESYVQPLRLMATQCKHELTLVDGRGQVRQHAMGSDRAACINALRLYGFSIQEEPPVINFD